MTRPTSSARTSLQLAALTGLLCACSAGNGGTSFDTDGAGGSGSITGEATTGQGTTGDLGLATGAGVGGGTALCAESAESDGDGDGFRGIDGDCNDCDPNVNPGAIEVIVSEPGEDGEMPAPADEDCDAAIDEIEPPCDATLDLEDSDAMSGARAIELCQETSASEKRWGVLAARYVRANGSPVGQTTPQVGLLSKFGGQVLPQGGARLLGLSSGHARTPGQPDACGQNSCDGFGAGSAPAGFPQDVPGCDGASEINDDVGLELSLRAPTNATGYTFAFDFYSFEYPEWVCTDFNDQFIALVSPPPAGSINGNISFDSQNNPVSVNIAFFNVCAGCALGADELNGTGFGGGWDDDAGATSWLETTAPVKGGDEITIRFAIWDTGDSSYDSTVLVDAFRWIANGGTVSVGTVPVPK
jgi:hypothetical protein